MADDVLFNKAATIERCLQRIETEYLGADADLSQDLTRQDAVVLNLQRACQACIDMAMHVVRLKKLGLPQESREAFRLLQDAGLLEESLSDVMQAMVGFRNVAVHNYRALSLEVLAGILDQHLGDLADFSEQMVRRFSES